MICVAANSYMNVLSNKGKGMQNSSEQFSWGGRWGERYVTTLITAAKETNKYQVSNQADKCQISTVR